MKAFIAALLAISLIATRLPHGLTLASTAPAFMWSPHLNGMKEVVNYQTISPEDLVRSVLSDGSWSNLLCPGIKVARALDLALVFVGRELESVDIARGNLADPTLVNLLKVSFTRSNFSMAFPFVAASQHKEMIGSSLISSFTETCGPNVGISNVTFLGSCSFEGENFVKLADLLSVQDFLVSRMEKRSKGQPDLVVFCHGGSRSLKELRPRSESEIFSELISSVEQLGAKYAVLYVSDPFRSIQYPSYRELQRFLVEVRNESANSTACDEVCHIKSSLLEGILVGIVLLIILISGLCCMMGIDTPTRFEIPQDS